MREVKRKNPANDRSVQYNTTQEIPKKRVIRYHREPQRLYDRTKKLIGGLWKLEVIIDYVEMMTHILKKLTEEYENTIEKLKMN